MRKEVRKRGDESKQAEGKGQKTTKEEKRRRDDKKKLRRDKEEEKKKLNKR